jgi:preprotein translocase subunit SecG
VTDSDLVILVPWVVFAAGVVILVLLAMPRGGGRGRRR